MADKKRDVFIVGLAAGAAVTWLLMTKRGKQVRGRVLRSGAAAGDGVPFWQDEASDGEAVARSEALRQKVEETRRRLREQVGLPPEE